MTALSILELVRVTENTDARGALDNARDLAAHAEQWGYRRIWVAEHHNMPGTQRAHWPSVRLRQEFVHPARRWWPTAEPSVGSSAAFTAVLAAQASEGSVRASLTAS